MIKAEFKPKAGHVYVVTNECLKLVPAKGVYKGRKVKAVKIGNARDFTSRLGTLNTAVYENFDFHIGIKTDDVVGLENTIHEALQDYRIMTRSGQKTEFFALPCDEAIRRIKNLAAKSHRLTIEECADVSSCRTAAQMKAKLKEGKQKRPCRAMAVTAPAKKQAASEIGRTELAKTIARSGGNEGAYGTILHFFSKRNACKPTSKWRKLLEDYGVKFDNEHFVSDWKCAQVRG